MLVEIHDRRDVLAPLGGRRDPRGGLDERPRRIELPRKHQGAHLISKDMLRVA